MATNEMIKFYKGLEAALPVAGASGALYITTDEGGIYLGTGTGMKRLGDFVQVANVSSLPAKAHESCLYYCVAENILAKWNGTEWKQINKQPTAEELKTLLGLGTLAYKSEVAESDLNAALAEKVNAAAEGNHSHSNKTVLDGITAEKVSAWDSAESNAKAHADGLDSAMNTRVEALEAIDHDHSNKAELDLIVTGDKAKWDAAAEKAHTHANAEELAKIAAGDKAKWDAVAADHLTSTDKATLENSIKDAKKAGTDANTNIETYKVSNDARVKAVEDDIAELADGTNGILAQAKSYSDGKLATARTEISAEIDADVKVVSDELTNYKSANDTALAGVKATAEAAATKTYTDTELAKKVDKVTGKSLVDDAEITKLAGVSAGANKVEASNTNGNIKIDGVETTVYTHPEKHTVSEISDFDEKVKAYDYATKAEAQAMADGKDTAIAEAKQAGTDAKTYAEGVAGDLATHITTADGKFETKEDAGKKLTEAKGYTDTEVAKVQGAVDELGEYVGEIPTGYTEQTVIAYINKKAEETLSAAQGGSSETAASVKQQLDNYKSENDTRVENAEKAIDAIEADYVKSADIAGFATKDELGEVETALNNYKTSNDAAVALKADKTALAETDATLAEVKTVVDNFFSEDAVVNDVVDTMKEIANYIATDKEGAADIAARVGVIEGKVDVTKVSTAISTAVEVETNRATGVENGLSARIKDLEDNKAGYATTGEVATAKQEAITAASTDATTKADAAQAAAEATAAGALSAAKTELEGKITAGDTATLTSAKAYADTAKSEAIAAAKTETESQVKALADGQVNTNKEDIASLFEQMTWGSF